MNNYVSEAEYKERIAAIIGSVHSLYLLRLLHRFVESLCSDD